MKKQRFRTFLTLLLCFVVGVAFAQKRDAKLTIAVTADTGESLEGQVVELEQTDYQMSYGDILLDADGKAQLNVYKGKHRLTITRAGFVPVSKDFNVEGDMTVDVALAETVTKPYSLTAEVIHDAVTGNNDIRMTWNKEKPVFSDDFESYSPFAVQFGSWTGIDGDGEMTAPLTGDYPNKSTLQYAQIINPMTVSPPWWYEYAVLRPYSGQQYVGFIRTNSGRANDDWLISPAVTPGNQNSLSFMAKAGDVYMEKFQVYVTEKTDNPKASDFVMISNGNYETVDYKGWKRFSYDLGAYAGKSIKFAIRYISDASNGGAFMLMVDDVEVGQAVQSSASGKAVAARKAMRSPMNPNESFKVYLNGEEKGTTDQYEYTFTNLKAGTYKLGVKAVYKASETDVTETTVVVSDADMARYSVVVKADNGQSLDGSVLTMADKTSAKKYSCEVKDGKAEFASLPYGSYVIELEADGYEPFSQDADVTADAEVEILVKEVVVTPFNITADVVQGTGGLFDVALKWNRDISFKDDFESYDDFAQGSFGQWKSYDLDGKAVYPIGLGSQTNIVTFPGASTPTAPSAIAPIIFNAWNTTPPMLPTDIPMTPASGNKQVVFFSPQQAQADKWLVSPKIKVRDGYVLRVATKSYDDMYPENLEFCVSTTDGSTSSFKAVSRAEGIPGGSSWTIYETDLAPYAGQEVWIGIHYVTYDGFFAQLDDFYVGPKDEGGTATNVGAVKSYKVYLDGSLKGTSAEPSYRLEGVSAGQHTVGVKAVYTSRESELAEYTFDVEASGISSSVADDLAGKAEFYTLDGTKVSKTSLRKGVYIRKIGDKADKFVVK